MGRHGIMVAADQGTSGSGGLSLIFGGGGGAARMSIANTTNVSGIAGTNGTGSGGSGGIQTIGSFGATGGQEEADVLLSLNTFNKILIIL